MLTLYHFPGAICAQKVRVCLAEKQLRWESCITAGRLRTPEYLRLNPGGYVPTLVHDDRVVTESRVINEYLNDAFPQPALLPSDPYDRARVALWTKQIDDSLHLNVFTLSLAGGFLPHFLRMSPDQLELNLPFDLTKRERALDIIHKGTRSHYVVAALGRFARLTKDMDAALQRSHWLVGDTYTLADVDFSPYLQRLEDLGLAALWADKPALARWIDRVRARPSYAEVIDRWFAPEELARIGVNASQASRKFEPLLDTAAGR